MDHSIFLASYVADLNRRETEDRTRREQQYFLEQAHFDTSDFIRRLVVAAVIISVSYSSVIVAAGYAAPDVREGAVLVS